MSWTCVNGDTHATLKSAAAHTREARDEVSRARVHPAQLKPGTRYHWSRGHRINTGVFQRYEIAGDQPVAIFTDFVPPITDWTPNTEVVVGLSWLIDTTIEEAL